MKTTPKHPVTRNWKKTPAGKRSIPTVRKAFAILELLCSDARPYSVSEISKIFRLPMSSSSTLLNTLEQCGYLKRDRQRQFSLTLKMLSDGIKALNQVPLRDVAEPEIKRLTESTGLGSIISVLDGHEVVCIHKIEGRSDIQIASYVGKRSPLHATATGKAILSQLSVEDVERIVGVTGLSAFTRNTITALPKVQKELTLIRKQGYAVDNEEHGLGIKGIASPVFDFQGKVVAAVGVGGAIFELDARDRELIEAVKSCASRISAAIGFRV